MSKSCHSRRRLPGVLLSLAFSALAGCGAHTGEVTGTVTFEGKTVASGTVIIAGSDDLPYYGVIKEDGTYTVAKVPLGPARISVVSPGPDDGKHVAALFQITKNKLAKPPAPPPFRGDRAKWFPLPKEFGDFDKSRLSVSVTSGVNRRDLTLE